MSRKHVPLTHKNTIDTCRYTVGIYKYRRYIYRSCGFLRIQLVKLTYFHIFYIIYARKKVYFTTLDLDDQDRPEL